eukprot:6706557-Ditylum_brightwellii.AAC.1
MEELKFSLPVGLSHGPWTGLMESGCDRLKVSFVANTSLIILLGVCTKVVANKKDILGASGEGDCAGACAKGVKF